jgi:GNAT superfamily N-acetyltransferase
MKISFEIPPAKEDLAVLRVGLKAHGEAVVGDSWIKDLAYFLRDEAGAVRGGVFGNCGSFGWLYVDTLWVDEALRGRGHGAELMAAIEDEARRRLCRHAYLSTFAFQAPGFYEKLGYYEFGRLDDFPPGHSRLFLRKDLTADP